MIMIIIIAKTFSDHLYNYIIFYTGVVHYAPPRTVVVVPHYIIIIYI